jgi:signal peptidase I
VMAGAMVEAGLRHRRLQPNLRWSAPYALIAFGGMIALSLGARALVVEAFKIPSSNMYPTLEIDDHIFVNKLAMRVRGPERGEVIVFRQPCMPERDYIKRVIALGGETVEIRCGVVHVNGAAVPSTLVQAEDRYRDRHEGRSEWVEQQASRYRETIGDHTFEVFHDEQRPRRDEARRAGATAVENDSKDFPMDETLRSCSNLPPGEGGPAANQQPGKIVTTDPAPADVCKPHRHYVVPPDHVFVMGDNRPNSNDSRYWGSVPVAYVKGPVIGIWLPFGRIGRIE